MIRILRLLVLAVAVLSLSLGAATIVVAQTSISSLLGLSLLGGEEVEITCDSTLTVTQASPSEAHVLCEPPVDATPTPTPYEQYPVCDEALHDPNQWHGLVNEAAQCHYTHEHKDDPRVLDSVLGPIGADWGGTSISYPWETHSNAGSENEVKHRVYGWSVYKDLPCNSNSTDLSFTNIRAQVHADGNGGAATRNHSYYLQAQACSQLDPTWHGTISIGGHQDFGHLEVFTLSGPLHVPLPDDPISLSFGEVRRHGSLELRRDYFGWYGSNLSSAESRDYLRPYIPVRLAVHGEDWGPVDPTNPSQVLFYGGAQNGSWIQLRDVRMYLPVTLDILDGTRDGYVTYHGYTDRYGYIVYDCMEAGVDCIPLHLENMKLGSYRFEVDVHGLSPVDHDVSPAGQSWIEYPN